MGNSPRMIRENYNVPQSPATGIAYFSIEPPNELKIIRFPQATCTP